MLELAEEISYSLSNIFRLHWVLDDYQKYWLTANISPIYKGGQRVDPKKNPIGEPYQHVLTSNGTYY